ncbi:MAG: molybdopterin-guanine dinucleotide biosynthesis protein B, partial [Mesorhizobium sp.]
MRPVFGITGWKNSGKTTLTVKLVAELVRRGWTVSTVKHAHHDFDIDKPGTDSFRHRQAGAMEVAVVSGRRWALMHELRNE